MKQSAKSLGLSDGDVLDAYADEFVADRLQPDEFTIRMFVDKLKARGETVTHIQALRKLEQSVMAGKLTVRDGIANGRHCKIYRKK